MLRPLLCQPKPSFGLTAFASCEKINFVFSACFVYSATLVTKLTIPPSLDQRNDRRTGIHPILSISFEMCESGHKWPPEEAGNGAASAPATRIRNPCIWQTLQAQPRSNRLRSGEPPRTRAATRRRPRFQVDDTAQVVAAEVRPMTAPAQGRACARGSAARHTSTRQPLNARLAGRASLGGAGGGGPNQGGLSPPPGGPAAGAQRFRRRGNIQTAGGL